MSCKKKRLGPRRSIREQLLEIEAWLHSIGYQYTGPGNLYGVSFIEIQDLSKGQRLLALTTDGVTIGEEAMLDKLAEEYG